VASGVAGGAGDSLDPLTIRARRARADRRVLAASLQVPRVEAHDVEWQRPAAILECAESPAQSSRRAAITRAGARGYA
jgi:hypothetical protein